MARILDSAQFRQSTRLQTFLRFVVCSTLEGKAEEIKESTIGSYVPVFRIQPESSRQ